MSAYEILKIVKNSQIFVLLLLEHLGLDINSAILLSISYDTFCIIGNTVFRLLF